MPRRECVVVDLDPVRSKQALHEVLQGALKFPDWYGRNWDAFWDAITGLVEMPEVLKLLGWQSFQVRLPIEARQLRSALEEMSEKYPELAAVVHYE